MARITLRGNTAVRWHSTVPSNLAALSVATELGADDRGVATGEAIANVEGWETSASTIGVPDILSLQTGTIPGETTFPVGQVSYYTDDTTNAIFAARTEGTSGAISFWPGATLPDPVATEVYTIFEVEVIDRARALSMGNEAEMHTVSYAIQSRTEGTAAA